MIEHVRKHGHEDVQPTLRMLRYWWGRINREVFSGELLPCQLAIESCAGEQAVGLCYPLDCGRVRIVIDPAHSSKVGWLSTLAHEMVHQHQHQHGLSMDHGKTFQRWADPILGLTGLTI